MAVVASVSLDPGVALPPALVVRRLRTGEARKGWWLRRASVGIEPGDASWRGMGSGDLDLAVDDVDGFVFERFLGATGDKDRGVADLELLGG